MTRYVALLKGINVGKAKRVAMADLRAVMSGLGLADVATHLQSGNAAFTAEDPGDAVGRAIEKALLDELKLDVRVVVRTHAQLVAAVGSDPYSDIADDPAKHLLGFFSAIPDAGRVAAFEDLVKAKHVDPAVGGLHHIDRDHCYLWCPQGALKSLFGTVDWDRKLGVTVTMRNWTTALKLVEMSA
ncbi:Uncharacterized conserved protein, DUF1697 family [Nakamurella panacisegetis]|uniref:Uncharacterized conserved protein, DUF1697 family n=1 Tax=Nakamurella panacisegetis TaxID=1090615 RepID=A0A1H0MJ33_9ACTN|nr:DUF1697 domain-containing protein [Nakamurella panacisegetis]SDO80397.1 Uncharacterized conserved protein, DUF1697 family [Nakamurella panacisegetis]